MASIHLSNLKIWRSLEALFAIIGLINCLFIAILFTAIQLSSPSSQLKDLYPFPALYLIEICLLGAIGFASTIKNNTVKSSPWSHFPWLAAGGLLAFVILGAWTIGFYLIPGMMALLAAGIIAKKRQNSKLWGYLSIFLSASLIQAIAILIIFNLSG